MRACLSPCLSPACVRPAPLQLVAAVRHWRQDWEADRMAKNMMNAEARLQLELNEKAKLESQLHQ